MSTLKYKILLSTLKEVHKGDYVYAAKASGLLRKIEKILLRSSVIKFFATGQLSITI